MPMISKRVSTTAVILLDSLHLLRQYQDVQFELLQHHIKCHPDPLESVQEMKANRFCVLLTLRPPATVKVTEGCKLITVNGAYRHGRYERIGLKRLHTLSNIKGFAPHDGRPDEYGRLHRSICCNMDQCTTYQ